MNRQNYLKQYRQKNKDKFTTYNKIYMSNRRMKERERSIYEDIKVIREKIFNIWKKFSKIYEVNKDKKVGKKLEK